MMKTEQEINQAHNLLDDAYVASMLSLNVSSEDAIRIRSLRMVLCWVLGHPTDEQRFQSTVLDPLKKRVEEFEKKLGLNEPPVA